MNRIRPWLYIGKYRDTTDQFLLEVHQVGAMLQLAELFEQPGIVTLYLAVDDGVTISPELLKRGIDFVKSNHKAGRKTLVACGAGISRSAAFVIASLMEIEQLSLLEAYREVKLHHNEAMPHPALWLSLCKYYNEEIAFSEVIGNHQEKH